MCSHYKFLKYIDINIWYNEDNWGLCREYFEESEILDNECKTVNMRDIQTNEGLI